MLKKMTFSLFIILSITTTAYGMEVEETIIPIDILSEISGETNEEFDDALDREITFIVNEEAEPDPKTYVVKEGDNLFRISVNNGIDLEDLIEWNNLTSILIHPGDELLIYEEGEAPVKKDLDNGKSDNIIVQAKETNEKNVKKTIAKTEEKKVNNSKSKTNEQNISLNSGKEPNTGVEMIVSATAYTAYCEGCSGTTAIGIDLRANPNQKVVAVDPSIIPLGSRVWVEGYGEAIAGDTGGAIKGNKIDVFIPSHEQAMQWGRKNVKIRILN